MFECRKHDELSKWTVGTWGLHFTDAQITLYSGKMLRVGLEPTRALQLDAF